MKMKKLGAVLMAAALMMGVSMQVADAARGGARISAPRVSAPAPKASSSARTSGSTASSATKKDTPNTREYAPSKKADEYGQSAPVAKGSTAASTSSAAANTAANSTTRWGSALRTVGMLAGGMMLGSMLSHLFGFGAGGWLADVLGVVANIAIFAFVLSILYIVFRKVMGRFSGNSRTPQGFPDINASRTRRREQEPVYTIDIEKPAEARTQTAPTVVQDIKLPSAAGSVAPGTYRNYDQHATAERYRRM